MKNTLRCLPSILLLGAGLLACTDEATLSSASAQEELTSATARSRELKFESMVYVDEGATDERILQVVRAQSQTAFGALKNAEIGVNSRELKDVNPATFQKSRVTVVDPAQPNSAKKMQRVRYTYTDDAVVPVAQASRSSLGLAVMNATYKTQEDRIFRECTDNDEHAREMTGAIWYVFNPSLPQCREAMTAEQKRIDVDRARLTNPNDQVTASEVGRLYLPITVSLGPDKTNRGKAYPEYHRLWAGGIKPGKLTIGLVNGVIDHGGDGDWTDSGMTDWMTTIASLLSSRPGWKLTSIEPQEDLSTLTLASGKKLTGLSFDDFIIWKLAGSPHEGLNEAEQKEAGVLAAKKIARHYITWAAPLKVKIGDEAAKDFTIEVKAYFGADTDPKPHKRLIKESDVFVYNGHSNIGYGPLDPSNFSASDFPSSYQILFIDGCVSYNYYSKDYFPLKQGRTKNLELITNGLEAPSYKSGEALGDFLVTLTNGKQASYLELLEKAKLTDRLRVVDGELDNEYSPAATPITVSKP